MKRVVWFFVIVFCFAFTSSSCETGTDSEIFQYGITWILDNEYKCGTFVNGDYWVLDEGDGVGIVDIRAIDGETLSGSMLNPLPSKKQGYSPRIGDTYDASYNVGLSLPLEMKSKDILVSTTSWNYGDDGHLTYVNHAQALTVLDSIPPEGSFRPGLSDLDRAIYNEADIDYSRLGNLDVVGSPPSLDDVSDSVSRLWLDHLYGWEGRQIHPVYNMKDYGGALAGDISVASLIVNSNYDNSQKRDIVIGLIQIGLDSWSNVEGYRTFYAAQPVHLLGRKFPVIFAGEMLDIQEIKNMYPKAGSYLHQSWGSYPSDSYLFSEDTSIWYVAMEDVEATLAGEAQYYSPDYDYTEDMIGMPEWFHHYYERRYRGNPHWTVDPYRYYSNPLTGTAISVYEMGILEEWNNQAFFDYLDRFHAIEDGLGDPFGFEVPGEAAHSHRSYMNSWTEAMWDEYRDDYDSSLVRYFECNDSIDNDGDGLVDYPLDLGCDSLRDDDESNCGDLVCEELESCKLCEVDCGECPLAYSVLVDSNYSGYVSSYIDDDIVDAYGGTSSTWASEESLEQHWVEINFAESKTINNISIYWGYNEYRGAFMSSQEVLVYVWDGEDYVFVGNIVNEDEGAMNSLVFDDVNALGIRILQDSGKGFVSYPNVMWISEVDYSYEGGGCVHEADLGCDGVDFGDLVVYIERWKRGEVELLDLVRAVDLLVQ